MGEWQKFWKALKEVIAECIDDRRKRAEFENVVRRYGFVLISDTGHKQVYVRDDGAHIEVDEIG